jgi:uncharacterized protein (DUF1684 family)
MKLATALACGGVLMAATGYQAEQQAWRSEYEAKLKSPTGWAAVAGLYWLHEGINSVGSSQQNDVILPASAPPHAGKIELHNGHVSVDLQGKKSEVTPETDEFQVGGLTLMAVKRDKRYGIRLWDPHAETIKNFQGLHWYPVDERARVTAKWVPFPAVKKIPIVSVLGYTEMNDAPGYAQFSWQGKIFKVEPVIEEDHLFLMFKDPTSHTETYHSGRFLTVAMPKDGTVILDFNQSRNPPCAFTSFATCPIPPRQNWLDVPVKAGEKRYLNH